jgi:hypothetical protein
VLQRLCESRTSGVLLENWPDGILAFGVDDYTIKLFLLVVSHGENADESNEEVSSEQGPRVD